MNLYQTLLSIAALAVSALTAFSEVERPQPERFYNQKEWGTRKFQLLAGDNVSLTAKISQLGDYSFAADGAAVNGFTKLQATVSSIENCEIFPTIVTVDGVQLIARSAAVDGNNTWNASDFAPANGNSTISTSANLLGQGWLIKAKGPSAPRFELCQIYFGANQMKSLFVDNVFPRGPLPWSDEKPAPSTPPDARPRVCVAESSLFLGNPVWIKSFLEWSSIEFPGQFGVDIGTYLFAGLENATKDFRSAGVFTVFESHLPGGCLPWLFNQQLYATRHDGFSPNSPLWPKKEAANFGALAHHAPDTTQKKVFELVSDHMEMAFSLGFDSYLLIDYVWPYFGGRWGYGPSAIGQWKKYLGGTGDKLELVSPDESWSFSDYWSHFSDVPLQPESFGWMTWSDFFCGKEQDAANNKIGGRRLKLFNALWHFHHLVFINQLGKVACQRSKELAVSLNPEDIGNGCDTSLMARLRDLGAVGFEAFGNPASLQAIRHTLPHLRYRSAGPFLDLIGEINAGGHGPSRYDRDVAFAFYYCVSASMSFRHYNNQYLEALWPNKVGLDSLHLERFNHWYAGARAFLLRHSQEERTVLPRASMTVIASRSVLEYENSSTHSLDQTGNLARFLAASNFNFEQVGSDVWRPENDAHTKVLVYSPGVSTGTQRSRIERWLKQGSGRTLILHGGGFWKDEDSAYQSIGSAVEWDSQSGYGNALVRGQSLAEKTFIPLLSVHGDTTVHLDGKEVKTVAWKAGPQGEVLLEDAAHNALITKWMVGENAVVHINVELSDSLAAKVIERAMSACGEKPFAGYNEDLTCQHFDVMGGDTIVAWDKKTLEIQAPKNRYERVALTDKKDLVLFCEPSSSVIIYSVFSGTLHAATSDEAGKVTVPIEHSVDQFYYGPDTPEFRQKIDAAMETYALVKSGGKSFPKSK